MDIDWELAATIGVPIITLFLGAIFNHFAERRPKLVSHLGFISSHKLEDHADGTPGPRVNTHSVIVRNTGREAAENVRLGHNFLPRINVYPDVDYEIHELPGGGKEIVFPKLVPKKEVSITYLYFAPDTWDGVNTHIESDSGPAKVVTALLQVQPPNWYLNILRGLILLGLTTSVYFLVLGIRWFDSL